MVLRLTSYKNLTCFKAYDIRGKLGEELNEGVAYRIGRATAQSQNAKNLAVGFDARATSPDLAKAVVKGVNLSKKHQKQDQKNEGGIINKEMPITLSNLMILDKKTKKGTRVGYSFLKDNKKVRINVKTGEQIDG